MPMPLPASRYLLQERCRQLVLLKLGRKRFVVSHQRKEIGLWKQLAQRLDDTLAPAPSHKPVMNNGYAHFTAGGSELVVHRSCLLGHSTEAEAGGTSQPCVAESSPHVLTIRHLLDGGGQRRHAIRIHEHGGTAGNFL